MPYGDCFILQWDSVCGVKRTVILDSGTQTAYCKHIRSLLSHITSDIDLWIISHSHNDHIGGVLKFADDLNGGILNLRCNRWLFNYIANSDIPISYNQASLAESVRQSSKLSDFLNNLGFSSKDCAAKAGMTFIIDDVKFTILSPINLQNISEEEKSSPTSFAAAYNTDYNKTIDSFNDNIFIEDTNAMNAGSIAVMVEYATKKFLWLSDACPTNLCYSLKALGYSKSNPLVCDYITLPHHGSKGNTSKELLELLQCTKYIVTADGNNIYNLPSKETLAKIITHNCSVSESEIEFLFPSSSETPYNIFSVDGISVYDKYRFRIKTGVSVLNLIN